MYSYTRYISQETCRSQHWCHLLYTYFIFGISVKTIFTCHLLTNKPIFFSEAFHKCNLCYHGNIWKIYYLEPCSMKHAIHTDTGVYYRLRNWQPTYQSDWMNSERTSLFYGAYQCSSDTGLVPGCIRFDSWPDTDYPEGTMAVSFQIHIYLR
jgi:hypothetical protein